MSNSSLVDIKMPAYHYSIGRSGRKIEMITIHHMAGVMTAVRCGQVFQGNRQASAHYGVGKDAEIGQYVDEADTAWANSDWNANCKAVTIETSNDSTGGEWHVSDIVLNKLIALVADIAKRNNLGTLVKGKNLTWHRMYAKTTCPGEYLLSKMDYIVDEANKINQGDTPAPQPTPTPIAGKIADIQRTLNDRYGFGIAVDNIYGPATKKALVKALQTELNKQYNAKLVIDGIFGPATKAKCPNVKEGTRGNITWTIQAMLVCKGYDLAVDGIFGAGTKAKVKAFQSANGLTSDGIVGKNTFEKLFK